MQTGKFWEHSSAFFVGRGGGIDLSRKEIRVKKVYT